MEMAKVPQTNKLIPMVPVKCPLCEGRGRVMSIVVKTLIKCHGCEGKGWVEVHMAKPVNSPPVIPIGQPIPQTPKPQQDDWKKWTINEPWTYGGSSGANGSGSYTTTITTSGASPPYGATPKESTFEDAIKSLSDAV